MRRLLLFSAFGALLLGALTGCSKLNTPETGTMSVRMTDAPGDFDAVNLSLTQIAASIEDDPDGVTMLETDGVEQVTEVDDDDDDGDSQGSSDRGKNGDQYWTVLWTGQSMCDLLELRNGVFTELGSALLPSGQYRRVRMKFGSGSNVVVNGVAHPLVVPRDGIKLKGRFEVRNGGTTDIRLDFNVARSIVRSSNGVYYLRSSIRVFTFVPDVVKPEPGAIAGGVHPPHAMAWVMAIQGADTVASTTTAADGHFMVSLLPAGSYSLAFHSPAGFEDQTLANVVVAAGATTDVGTVELTTPPPPPPPPPGTISGTVTPSGVPGTAFAVQGSDTLATASVAGDGSFTLSNLSAGTYSVCVHAESGYEDGLVSGVSVTSGGTTFVNVELTPLPPPPPPPPGAVIGRTVPGGVPCTVTLMDGSNPVATTDAAPDGTFSLSNIAAGSYVLVVHPWFDYQDSTVNVTVNSGATTDVGDIHLQY
jgi:hypothetical protein